MGVDTDGEAERNNHPDLSGHRVLVAEDNSLNWEVLHELLSDVGLELEWAENGKLCLDKFEQSEAGYYEAILMDFQGDGKHQSAGKRRCAHNSDHCHDGGRFFRRYTALSGIRYECAYGQTGQYRRTSYAFEKIYGY